VEQEAHYLAMGSAMCEPSPFRRRSRVDTYLLRMTELELLDRERRPPNADGRCPCFIDEYELFYSKRVVLAVLMGGCQSYVST
jgi:hypothetical protein